jgi:hypothetical protein
MDRKEEKTIIENVEKTRQNLPLKKSCNECDHYSDCPRMKGINICYGRLQKEKEPD